MATVTRNNIGLLHDTLTITVSTTDYMPAFDNELKTYSKQANMPGFRKGMVPTGLMKKMYGKSVYTQEVIKCVEKSLTDYLTKEALDIFAQPIASDDTAMDTLDYNYPKEYSFVFEIGLKPIIELAPLSQANLPLSDVIITDDMVQEEIERQQNKLGNMKDLDVVTSIDDVLNVTFSACDAAGEILINTEAVTNSLLVKYFTTEYQNQLLGKQVGDSITLQLSAAFENNELAVVLKDLGLTADNKDAYYSISITKIGILEKRALDETFYNQLFPGKEITTEAGLKEALHEDLKAYWSAQANNQLQDKIYHYLIDNTTVDFPEQFLKKWMQTNREKKNTAEEVEAEYPNFIKSLKWTIISDELCKANNITVTKEDIRNFAEQQLMGYMGGMQQSLDMNSGWVTDYINKMMADQKYVEDTYHRAQTEKLFSWAITQVNTTLTPITVAEFTARAQSEAAKED